MGRFSYLAVLAFVVLGSGWLELVLRTRVLRRWKRLLLAMVPGVVLFCAWDAYAIAQGHWTFDTDRILGIYLPFSIPLDELLFFMVIPFASILTLEAVRSVKGSAEGWGVGDEGEGR
jgi:lycopene cyclase domain-containing protein